MSDSEGDYDSGLDAELDLDDGELMAEAVAAGMVQTVAPKAAINDVEALTLALSNIKQAPMPWIERVEITAPAPLGIDDHNDDLKREVAFYKQALGAVHGARSKCETAGIPHIRPADYFAEMMKDDGHMARVKAKLLFEQRKIQAFEERKKNAEARKFQKEVAAERQKARTADKKGQIEAVKAFRKRKDKGAAAPMDDKALDLMLSSSKAKGPRADYTRLGKGAGAGAGAGAGEGFNKRRANKNSKYGSGQKERKRGGVGGPAKKRGGLDSGKRLGKRRRDASRAKK